MRAKPVPAQDAGADERIHAMTQITRTIRRPEELILAIRLLERSEFPMVLTVRPGEETRTQKQNRLQWQWFADLASQGDQSAEQYRAYCKLHFGIPIRREDEAFRAVYDRVLKPLPYEAKIACMVEPIDLPVTRDMTIKQLTRYLDEVQRHFAAQGFALTDPAMLGIEDFRQWTR